VTREIRPTAFHFIVIPSVAFLVLLFLVPHPLAAQEPIRSGQNEPSSLEDLVPDPWPTLKTSLRTGPLQRRLDSVFPDRFREGVDVLWGPNVGWILPEVFDWWAFRTESEGLTPKDAQKMFARLSAREPVFGQPSERQICAVVGASRNLLGSGYGNLIDAHDLVFRVNRAPTAKFDRDVGRKTTHHVMWPTALGPEQADRRAVLLMNPVTLHTKDVFGKILSLVEEDLLWEPSRVRIIHPEFVKYIHDNWLNGHGQFPSTGLIALMIAVHVCDEVDVFGFGADVQGRWDRYYEHHLEKPSDLHPADVEGDLRLEMKEKRTLKVFLGNRSRDGIEFSGFQVDESEHN